MLPESMKYLPKLKILQVFECKMFQCIPALPQSIQCFHVWSCQSLQTVLSSAIEPSKTPNCTFLLPNCIKLDEHSYDAILKDATVRIELEAKPLSAVVFENEEDASSENDEDDYFLESMRNGKICYYLLARSRKVRDWFHCHSTQALVTIEVPSNLLGFIFYLVVSQVQSCHIGQYGSIGCECYLETGRDERINITSFFMEEHVWICHNGEPFEFMGDHIFLWYDAQYCMQIMEVIKERKAINDKSSTHDPKLTFKFFAQTQYNKEAVIIKECGFRWMYSPEEEEEGRKSKRSREIHEAEETNVVRNKMEGSESNEQEEALQQKN